MQKYSHKIIGVLAALALAISAGTPMEAQAQLSSADGFVQRLSKEAERLRAEAYETASSTPGQVVETVTNSFDSFLAEQQVASASRIFDTFLPDRAAEQAKARVELEEARAAEERAQREAAAAAERAEREAQAATPRLAPNPCPPSAKACVDLKNSTSWLQDNGHITYGPVQVGVGKPGHETPPGSFRVNRKVRDEISYEFNNAPMPFATYFTYNGIAFHQGDPNYKSHGCVRMWRADAEHYFNNLTIGDEVYIF